MTEKEKCRLGLLYDANYDPEILADRERAKELLYDYNRLRPSEQIRRTELLKKLLGKTGENLIIEQTSLDSFTAGFELAWRLSI